MPYKTWWKPGFPMDSRPLVKEFIANFGIFPDVFEFLRFTWCFSVFQKIWVFGYSWSTLLWYQCYCLPRSRDALSPVCGIFIIALHCGHTCRHYPSDLELSILLDALYYNVVSNKQWSVISSPTISHHCVERNSPGSADYEWLGHLHSQPIDFGHVQLVLLYVKKMKIISISMG